jgi:hypothetical protein
MDIGRNSPLTTVIKADMRLRVKPFSREKIQAGNNTRMGIVLRRGPNRV